MANISKRWPFKVEKYRYYDANTVYRNCGHSKAAAAKKNQGILTINLNASNIRIMVKESHEFILPTIKHQTSQ